MMTKADRKSAGLRKGLGSQRGVTAIEYALLAALIAMAVIGGVSATGSGNGGLWGNWTAAFVAAISP